MSPPASRIALMPKPRAVLAPVLPAASCCSATTDQTPGASGVAGCTDQAPSLATVAAAVCGAAGPVKRTVTVPASPVAVPAVPEICGRRAPRSAFCAGEVIVTAGAVVSGGGGGGGGVVSAGGEPPVGGVSVTGGGAGGAGPHRAPRTQGARAGVLHAARPPLRSPRRRSR